MAQPAMATGNVCFWLAGTKRSVPVRGPDDRANKLVFVKSVSPLVIKRTDDRANKLVFVKLVNPLVAAELGGQMRAFGCAVELN